MDENYDFESAPELEFKRHDGSVIRFYRHKNDPYRIRALVDGKPYDPNDMLTRVKGKK